MSNNNRMGRQIVVYLSNRILLNDIKEELLIHAEQKNPGTEVHPLWFELYEILEKVKQSSATKNKTVVAWGWGLGGGGGRDWL